MLTNAYETQMVQSLGVRESEGRSLDASGGVDRQDDVDLLARLDQRAGRQDGDRGTVLTDSDVPRPGGTPDRNGYRDGRVAVHVHAADLDPLLLRRDGMARDDEQHDSQDENRADSTSHRRPLTSGRTGW